MDASEAQAYRAAVAPPPPGRPYHHLLAVAISLVGGVLGILGAAIQELRGGGLLLPFVGAPIIEEVMKPVGVYIVLIRWPHLVRNQLYIAALAALAGFSFGLIEALVYVSVYTSDPPAWFVTYRFSLPLLLHVTASFIVGLGINQRLLAWARDGSPLPKASRNFYIAGIVLHALFNTVTTALWLSGVLDVD